MDNETKHRESALERSADRGLMKRSSALVRRALENPLTQKAMSNSIGMQFVFVPPGSFEMGSESGYANEQPLHRVTIGQGFLMGKHEVTQGQWQAVMGYNPSYFTGDGKRPVEQVSWDDSWKFINELNDVNDGYRYRLPKEAEWEFACRAGTTSDCYNQDLDSIAWYQSNSRKETHRVGTKKANAFGLYDTLGNVWEWRRDLYHDNYSGAPTDGSAWLSQGQKNYRVVRGGSWHYNASFLRSAFRIYLPPDIRNPDLGLRLVAVARVP